ncbi:MAG: family 20 glycosylhydrolase [Armatimonadetes bacterium]|nr:family 20 glycosylhydrolase [Armatimonadota bacterium]
MRWISLIVWLAVIAQPVLADAKGAITAMKPKVTESREGAFDLSGAVRLLVGESLLKAKSPAYLPIQKRLAKEQGKELAAEEPGRKLPEEPFILVGLLKDHPALRDLEAAIKPKLPEGGLGDEGYLLEAAPGHILIGAVKPAGAFYGVQKLFELVEKGKISAARIADWPVMKMRGIHLYLTGSSLPAVESIVTELAPRLRLNQLIVEINYHFQYKSHPEVAEEGAVSREDCRRLAELGKKNFVRVIPMLNCLGHQSWADKTAKLLKAHPEFDETPNLPANNPDIYCRSWCPNHPDVNKVVFDLFDELIEAFQADAFHVGMDEIFILGGKDYRNPGEPDCPRCAGKDNAELIAKAINDYHKHLVGKRKVQMMMWGDRLLDSKTIPYGEWEASANGTAPAIKMIPKDIVMCDWHYEAPKDFPSVRFFQDQGFPVWPAGWNRVDNTVLLAGCALKNMGPKMVGYLATTWTSPESVVGGLTGDEKILKQQNISGLADSIRKGMEMAWEGSGEPSG